MSYTLLPPATCQEVYVDLSGQPTGLLVLNCNWGGGGWLKNSIETSSSEKSINSASDPDAVWSEPKAVCFGLTNSIENSEGKRIFRAVKVSP